ncbi:hypothetical protein BpHYR1_041482 [Brachionus plicatilis]|uniref:Uncharacterized protein n=1 Tax=Brachionus plicatilis TaxID=10195 RepID=A0A3M7RW75_BRAPC|nr:hypothetical protein BpHYR1_041482 [Brachionus plicatilis]
MPKREAALKALKALRNTDDTQSLASDNDDADFLGNHNFLDEFDEVDADVHEKKEKIIFEEEEVDDTNQHVIDSIESTINRKPGPTSYAARNIVNTKLSAFMMNFNMSILNLMMKKYQNR